MKRKNVLRGQLQKPADASRAFFSYVNQGSMQGREMQHWLEAEAQLLAERNLARVHGFHNQT